MLLSRIAEVVLGVKIIQHDNIAACDQSLLHWYQQVTVTKLLEQKIGFLAFHDEHSFSCQMQNHVELLPGSGKSLTY